MWCDVSRTGARVGVSRPSFRKLRRRTLHPAPIDQGAGPANALSPQLQIKLLIPPGHFLFKVSRDVIHIFIRPRVDD